MTETATAQQPVTVGGKPPQPGVPDEITLVDLVNVLLRRRFRILAIMLASAALFVLPLLFQQPTYTATTSFVLQGADQGRSGLAGLAGQFGVALPTAASAQSPQFFADLLRSREILGPIAADSFATQPGGRPVPLVDLFQVPGSTPALRREIAVRRLGDRIVTTQVSKTTGVVTVSATSEWPHVSLALTQRTLDGLNAFVLRMRQAQATADRRYSEERVSDARDALRAAENRLQYFLQRNRVWQGSPQLVFEHDRLEREVGLQQQVFIAAAEAHEEARARELRNTPVVTLVDSPELPASPNPRGRVRRAVMGLLVGALVGFLVALVGHLVARRRRAGDPEVETLHALLGEVRGDLTRWASVRGRRPATNGQGR